MNFNSLYLYPILIMLGLIPSIIWLLFYLQEDKHPEPKEMVVKIFLYGLLMTIPTLGIEIGLNKVFSFSHFSYVISLIINFFVIVALTEEVMKYLVIKLGVLNNPEFDEPIDAMIYMIIAALGFAAMENIALLFSVNGALGQALLVLFGRFIGATFLHALCSANIGYFLALSFLNEKSRFRFLFLGFGASILLHGFYDFAIKISGGTNFIIPALIIAFLFLLVMAEFRRIKKLLSVCKI